MILCHPNLLVIVIKALSNRGQATRDCRRSLMHSFEVLTHRHKWRSCCSVVHSLWVVAILCKFLVVVNQAPHGEGLVEEWSPVAVAYESDIDFFVFFELLFSWVKFVRAAFCGFSHCFPLVAGVFLHADVEEVGVCLENQKNSIKHKLVNFRKRRQHLPKTGRKLQKAPLALLQLLPPIVIRFQYHLHIINILHWDFLLFIAWLNKELF